MLSIVKIANFQVTQIKIVPLRQSRRANRGYRTPNASDSQINLAEKPGKATIYYFYELFRLSLAISIIQQKYVELPL
jgi:hypothetical protein